MVLRGWQVLIYLSAHQGCSWVPLPSHAPSPQPGFKSNCSSDVPGTAWHCTAASSGPPSCLMERHPAPCRRKAASTALPLHGSCPPATEGTCVCACRVLCGLGGGRVRPAGQRTPSAQSPSPCPHVSFPPVPRPWPPHASPFLPDEPWSWSSPQADSSPESSDPSDLGLAKLWAMPASAQGERPSSGNSPPPLSSSLPWPLPPPLSAPSPAPSQPHGPGMHFPPLGSCKTTPGWLRSDTSWGWEAGPVHSQESASSAESLQSAVRGI